MRVLISVLILLLRMHGTVGQGTSTTNNQMCADLPLPTPLQVEYVHECNSDYACSGNVLGCLCPQDAYSILGYCSPSSDYPYKRTGRCMCTFQPTPVAAEDRKLFGSPIAGIPEFVRHSGAFYWVVECPVCSINYQGQLSPNDPQGCRVNPDGAVVQNTAGEKEALDNLYSTTLGEHWLRQWDTSSAPCARYGVRCRGDTVVALELSSNNLQGVMPSSLALALPNLEVLDLSHNVLSGTIPQTVGGLVFLTHLLLAQNRFTGPIPPLTHCAFLSTLDLSNNQLTGTIDLNGVIPTRFAPPLAPPKPTSAFDAAATIAALSMTQYEVSSLIQLNLAKNGFSQIVAPSSALGGGGGVDWKIEEIDISYNAVSGVVPPWLLQLPSMRHLDVSYNLFSGPLPNFTLPSPLRRVSFRGNAISGTLPSSWVGLWDVDHLSASDARGGEGDLLVKIVKSRLPLEFTMCIGNSTDV